MRKIPLTILLAATCQSFSATTVDNITDTTSICTFRTTDGLALPVKKHFHDGKEIEFVEDPGNWFGASAHYLKGEPKVLYDPKVIGQYSVEFQAYTFQHELGHIKLNHHARNLAMYPAELEADCFAVKEMKKMGCSKKQIKNIHNQRVLFDYNPHMRENFWRCYEQ